MAEATYYYDTNRGGGTIRWSDYSYMVDGILTNYAYTSDDGAREDLAPSTCDGTDLGTITKVELRVYGYGDGDDRIDLAFSTLDLDAYQLIPTSSPDWTAYVDVTSDSYVGGWTWAKVSDIETEIGKYLYVEFDKVAKGNTMHCAKVEIRVTYTEAGGYYHGLKVQGVGELALCDVGTHPLRIRKGGATYGIELVETEDPNASPLRIKTGAGIKAIRKYT